MRKALGILAATVLAMGIAGASNATTMAFGGTITMQLGTLPGLVMPASGVATINGTGGLGHINTLAIGAGLFTASSTFSVNSGTVPYVQFTGIANNAGAFTGSPLAGTMGFSGAGRICVVAVPPCPVVVPFQQGTVGFGLGGMLTTGTPLLYVTLVNQPWTAGTAGGFTVHEAASTLSPVVVPRVTDTVQRHRNPLGADSAGDGIARLYDSDRLPRASDHRGAGD